MSAVLQNMGAGLDVGSLVPEAYAEYRPLVAEAFQFFVERLSPERRAGIVAEQMGLGAVSVAERIVALMHHCPVLHKLGQVVSRDKRLEDELRVQLQRLETLESRTPMDVVRAVVERELGELRGLGIELGDEALAEASVAVVAPFESPEGAGVFKVLKPGVEVRLAEELEILWALGGFLDERCAEFGLAELDYREAFEQVRDLLACEVHLDREQAHLREAGALFEDDPRAHVPRLMPYCTPRMTAMERIEGCKVTDAPGDRESLARTIVEAMIGRCVWSEAEATMFHADPHAGNLLVTPDGTLVMIDWSLVGRLSKSDRESIVQIVLGGVTLDPVRIERGIERLCVNGTTNGRARRVIDEALRRVRCGAFPGLDWLTELLDESVRSAGVRFGGDLLLFRKTLLTLEGVVADVWGECSADGVLGASGLNRLWAESLNRMISGPFTRSFGTHVSNADLCGLIMSGPATVGRYWLGMWSDALRR